MMTRARWIAVFLATTGAALGMECWASWDADPDTVPWTELIVTHVPSEVTAAAIGALVVWLPVHFARRYRRRARREEGER